jgi:ubiquitin related modifier 1
MLFDNITKHSLTLSKSAEGNKSPTVGDLVKYLCENVMKDERKELFVLDGNVYVRPVLAPWSGLC